MKDNILAAHINRAGRIILVMKNHGADNAHLRTCRVPGVCAVWLALFGVSFVRCRFELVCYYFREMAKMKFITPGPSSPFMKEMP